MKAKAFHVLGKNVRGPGNQWSMHPGLVINISCMQFVCLNVCFFFLKIAQKTTDCFGLDFWFFYQHYLLQPHVKQTVYILYNINITYI